MSDIKLFKLSEAGVVELPGSAMQVEKSLQTLFEANLEALLGIRFLATEHSTGPVHGGRIDTLGLDEDNSPVIIEYKRAVNENVINQGLFYLDWLMDHRKEFQWMVMEHMGADIAKMVDWSAPRLVCIAGDFTRYDGYAVKQIPRNIELIRYRRFGEELLALELVHAPKTASLTPKLPAAQVAGEAPGDDIDPYATRTQSYRLSQASAAQRDIYDALCQFLVGLGDDVQVKELKHYTAFKRIKNFACLQIYPQAKSILIIIRVEPSNVEFEEGFSRDVTNIGHHGSGNVEVSIKSMAEFEKAQPLLRLAYENG
ncbi:DUF91 domain-containing protein [Agrobacterium vitis]|uniref:DUF5655 domain-containing protein n=1 Tax=Agrobacterium vitis TaxID=373 RepID=UPI00137CED3D|nr:DUF91 domain-containing protein [Agrobacterium vitis]